MDKKREDHRNKTKEAQNKKRETLFWQKCRRFPPAVDIAFPLIHPEGPTQSTLRGH